MLFGLLALYGLILFPILRANRYYNDDLKRALIGHTGWDSNGRPLTTFLMKLLQCYDGSLVDISPLTQAGGIFCLAWAGVLLARRYDITNATIACLIAFPLGAQPFYLENLSYKFDALSMSLAVLLSVIPVLVEGAGRRRLIAGVGLLFLSLCLYQPAINVFLVFVVGDVLVGQARSESPRTLWKRCALQLLKAAVAMLVYQILVGAHVGGWMKRRSETLHDVRDFSLVGANLLRFCRFIADSFNTQWWRFHAPLVLLLALTALAVGLRYAIFHREQHGSSRRLLLVLLAFATPVAALAASFGPMLLLVDPLTAPRVFMGIGALLCTSLLVLHEGLRDWHLQKRITIAVAAMFAVGMMVTASAYGNALGAQRDFEDRIAATLADDLAAAGPGHAILIDGSAGFAPLAAHAREEFPLIGSLIAPYLVGDDHFHTHIYLRYFLGDFSDLRLSDDPAILAHNATVLASTCGVRPQVIRSHYGLNLIDDVIVVRFHGSEGGLCSDAAPNP